MNKKRAVHLTSIILLVGAVTLPIQTFSAPLFLGQLKPAGAGASAFVVADFNEDGNQDVIVASTGSNDVNVMLGSGSGSFADAVSYTAGTYPNVSMMSLQPASIAHADFNGDGNQDVVVGGMGSIGVLLGDGNGQLGLPSNYVSGVVLAIGSADFNGDNNLDIVAANADTNDVTLYFGDGLGGFSNATNYTVGSYPKSIATADFNNDNNTDIVVVNLLDNNVSLLLGNGVGGFATAVNFLVGSFPNAVAVADFNGDNNADMAVANTASDNVSVFLGDGAGGFAASVNYLADGDPYAISVIDFDKDNHIDLLVANQHPARFSVLLGDGTGTFVASLSHPAGANLLNVLAADFNNDQYQDVVVLNGGLVYGSASGVAVFLSNSQGDLNIPLRHITESEPHAIAQGDFNGDSHLDIATVSSRSTKLSLLFGTASGEFAAVQHYETTPGQWPIEVNAADFNRDGSVDLVSLSRLSLFFMLSDGAGGFNTGSLANTASLLQGLAGLDAMAVEDFNGDGKMDMAVLASPRLNILLGNGNGGFTLHVHYDHTIVGASSAPIISADVNADNKPDLVMVYNESPALRGISVMLGDGSGGFLSPVNYDWDILAGAITHGDFNQDGTDDIALVYGYGDEEIYVSFANSLGELSTPEVFNIEVGGPSPLDIHSTDINDDGRQDVIVTGINKFGVLAGDGAGGFAQPSYYITDAAPVAIASGDFDADGKVDLAVANWGVDNAQVFLNQSGLDAPPSGTLEIDGGKTYTNATSVILTLTCSDDVACTQMQFSNDNTSWEALVPYASFESWTLITGADGSRTVYARFEDGAGNASPVVSASIELDTIAPAVPIITAPTDNTSVANAAQPSISGTAETNAIISIQNGTNTLGVTPVTGGDWSLAAAGTLLEGRHTFTATATDLAGNTSQTSTTVTYTVDLTPPVISLTGDNPMEVTQGDAFSDSGAIATDNIDTGLSTTVSGTVNTAVLGSYTLIYSASDLAGNNAAPVTRTVNVVAKTNNAVTSSGGGSIGIMMLGILLAFVIVRLNSLSICQPRYPAK